MILETDRLIVRKFIEDDLEAFSLIMANPLVMRFSIKGPLSKDQTKEMLKHITGNYDNVGYGLYAVVDKAEHSLLGYVGLMRQNIDYEEKTELGYRIDPKYWGKGFATEASLAICQYAFDQLGIKELISIIDPQNIRSIEVAKRVGMHFWKNAIFHNIPVHVYALTK
jgi:[ribosomal protein S5]-alanine N-acetyltransferase